MDSREKIVIVGSGWVGYTLSNSLPDWQFAITIISPEPNMAYTPLLASAASGLIDYSLAEESIQRRGRKINYIQATVDNIDLDQKLCHCTPAFPALANRKFQVPYDRVVIAPGCTSQTFGTPGVAEHALFVKNVHHARAVRQRIHDMFEMASLPLLSDEEQRQLLHIAVVGAGPTGVEISAELYDLIHRDLTMQYPSLAPKASITIHDVAAHVLTAFDAKLGEYALANFAKRGVQVKTGSHITGVEAGILTTKEDGRIAFGMLIWATGNKQVELVDRLQVAKSERLPRILTNTHLNVYRSDMSIDHSAYALGDAADIKGGELPTTAEVACQKAAYLAQCLTKNYDGPFVYRQKAMVAYIGGYNGVIAGKRNYSGPQAFLAWRALNLNWTWTVRKKFLIVLSWLITFIFGKSL